MPRRKAELEGRSTCVKASLRKDRGRCDAEEESVSRLLESCYDDACAARFAAALGGREADAKFFLDRSRAWTNCFDAATGFIRAKDSKGEWREPFDPYAIDGKGLHNYTRGKEDVRNERVGQGFIRDPPRRKAFRSLLQVRRLDRALIGTIDIIMIIEYNIAYQFS